MDAQSLNIWETYPAVLDIPSLRAGPYLTRARIGADACIDVLARDFGQISTSGTLRFKVGEGEESWIYVALTADNTYAVEVGRSHAGGALDGAWIRLGFHDGVTGDQLAATVRSCALEA